MTRKELEELGYTPEQIDQLMDLNGKAINKIKQERDEALAKLVDTKEELEKREKDFNKLKESSSASDELQEQIEKLHQEYEEYKQQSAQREQELKLNSALGLAIAKSGTVDEVSLKANLNMEEIELTEEGLKGFEEQVKNLQEEKPFLFKDSLDGGFNHGEPPKEELSVTDDIKQKVFG